MATVNTNIDLNYKDSNLLALGPSAHLRPLATLAGLGRITRNSDLNGIATAVS